MQPLLNLWPVANGPEITTNGVSTRYCRMHRHRAAAYPRRLRHHALRLPTSTSKDTFTRVYTVDDSSAITPSADPYSYVDREPARAGAERCRSSTSFASAGEHRARRLFARQLLFLRLCSCRAAGARSQCPCRRPHLCRGHCGLNRLQWRVVHHRRRVRMSVRTTALRATSSPSTIMPTTP